MTRPEPKPGDACIWTPIPTLASEAAKFHEAWMDAWWALMIAIAPPFEWVLDRISPRLSRSDADG